jgi:hypothetical protein
VLCSFFGVHSEVKKKFAPAGADRVLPSVRPPVLRYQLLNILSDLFYGILFKPFLQKVIDQA